MGAGSNSRPSSFHPNRSPPLYPRLMTDSFEEQTKRLYGLGEIEREALEVLRLIVRQTERGDNLDAELLERAKIIIDRYDRAMTKGHTAPGVVPFR